LVEVLAVPSPFPGMNPYFEHRENWRGFHNTFLVYLRAALTPLVVPRYYVEIEEARYLDPSDDDYAFAVADIAVSPSAGIESTTASSAAAVMAAPVTVTIPNPARRLRRLAIRTASDRSVVTVIELLSPTNKEPGPDREQYIRKRAEVVAGGANLIEIDFLRGGPRMPILRLPACDYYVMVARRAEWPKPGMWAFGLRDRLPSIPVPLLPGEPEPVVDLQPVLRRVYDEGGYGYRIYTTPPEPPLSGEDASWAAEIVRGAVVM
jgi:hypothetical protein